MTLPGGIDDIDTTLWGITGDPAGGANTPATLQGWSVNNVQELLKQQYIGGAGSGTSVFTNPSGPLAQGVDVINTGIANAQASADYANEQLAVSNRLIVDLFDGPAGSLSANWDVVPFGSGGGGVGVDGGGNAVWNQFGGITEGVNCRWNAVQTTTDNQIVSMLKPAAVAAPAFGGTSWNRLYGRVNDVGTPDTGVYGQVTDSAVSLGYVVSTVDNIFTGTTVPVTMGTGDKWDFIAGVGGVGDDPYTFLLIRNGVQVTSFIDTTHLLSAFGVGFRSVGFGLQAASANPFILQILPGTMAVFSADDH